MREHDEISAKKHPEPSGREEIPVTLSAIDACANTTDEIQLSNASTPRDETRPPDRLRGDESTKTWPNRVD
jgi:hypothetical protein